MQEDFRANEEEGIRTIVIIDADTVDNQGSFCVRQEQVEKIKSGQNLTFECFLMPNHAREADGYLETALREILVEENQGLLDCLDANDTCLRHAQEKMEREINLYPLKGAEKFKINYLRNLLKDGNDYKDLTIWDLNHEYLNPLKEFLEEHLGLS